MARYNKIIAGPTSENTPQIHEAISAAAILPGRLVTTSAGAFALAGATTKTPVHVAVENWVALKDVDTAYGIGETVMAAEMLDECVYRLRLPTGVNVVGGVTYLSPAANGEVKIAATGEYVIARAAETYNNASGASQLINVRPVKGFISP